MQTGRHNRGERLDRHFDPMRMDEDPTPSQYRFENAFSDDFRMEQLVPEDKARWAVAMAFFNHRSLVADHVNSFDNFVEKGIHDLFREAEPFEVELPDEEQWNQRKIFVSFDTVEFGNKPEVDKDDRAVGRADKSGDKPFDKGKTGLDELEKGKASWFGVEDGPNDEAGGSGVKRQDSTSEDLDGERKDSSGKGKGKVREGSDGHGMVRTGNGKVKGAFKNTTTFDVNVTDLSDDSEMNQGLPEFLEPPKITQDSWALGDELDSDENCGVTEPDRIQNRRSSNANGLKSPASSPPRSPSKTIGRVPEGATNGTLDEVQPSRTDHSLAYGKANGKTNGNNSDCGDSSPSFGMASRRKVNLKLLPVEARLRGMTYSSPIYVHVKIETRIPDTNVSKKHKSSTSTTGRYKTSVQRERVLLGKMPVMVKSALCHLRDSHSEAVKGDCPLDPGGYFIIKGSEKVIVAQEERNLQRLWVSHNQGTWYASCTPRRKGFALYNYHRTIVKLAIPKKTGTNATSVRPLLTVSLPGVDAIPVGVYFSALGVSSDKEILEMVCYNLEDSELMQVVCPSLQDADSALALAMKEWDESTFDREIKKRGREVALHCIGSKTLTKIPVKDLAGKDVVNLRLLPHIGPDERCKALFLAYMVRTICLCFLGRQRVTDRDDFKNKRLDFAGEVISHHFRKLMGQVQNTMKKRIQKHLTKSAELARPGKYLDEKVITRGMKVAFTSGNWRGHDVAKNSGIVFDLKRGNPMSTLCQLRELRQFVPPTVRVGDEARHPTFSQWGRVCPIDTPDGESCGLVKNMAITGVVSQNTPEKPVLDLLNDSPMVELANVEDFSFFQDSTKIFVNGRWIGSIGTSHVAALVYELISARRKAPSKSSQPNFTQMEVSTNMNSQEIHISTDAGRVLRPLLIVEDDVLVLSQGHVTDLPDSAPSKRFQWLLTNGVVEFLGIEEEEKAMIALQGEDIRKSKYLRGQGVTAPKFTHAELHPSLILGLSASVIPFPNRNQSSRNLYQAHKHSKQAIGFYTTNISSRADTSGQHLFYPQTQLVRTSTYECLQKTELFSGQNAIVAIACYTGYNQEDSIIMDQSSLDRGMFRTTHYRTVRAEEKADSETFGKPGEAEGGATKPSRSLEKLDEDGLPGVGSNLGVGDVIVGKISKSWKDNIESTPSLTKLTDPSQRLKAHEKGRVDQVILLQDDDGARVAKVKLRETRMPQVGDKFSSMHGQKGIVGMVFTQEDLPFNCEGIVPDIIINPHAFPTRQTLGQMCESALGKAIAKSGRKTTATPFNPSSTVEFLADLLQEAGYERWGTEALYNGFTGLPMEAKIFIGTTFYQRLTHMVEDKIKYRSRGHVHPLTRQPVADRKRHGGVKFGEMERDCLIAHGASATLQERTFILSDFHSVHICTTCEQLANWDAERTAVCRHCSKKGKAKSTAIVKAEVPYACKLLMQELMSMGISVRLKTQKL